MLWRSLASLSNQEAGQVSIPSAAQPVATAARLGLPWPREGTYRCKGCTACPAGTCSRQKLEVICKGCQRKKSCEKRVCLQPWISDSPPGSADEDAQSDIATAESLGSQADHMEQAISAFVKSYDILTAELRHQELESEINPGCRSQALRPC